MRKFILILLILFLPLTVFASEEITQIGNMKVKYTYDKITTVGDFNIHYDSSGKVDYIGDMEVEWVFDKIIRIGDMKVIYY